MNALSRLWFIEIKCALPVRFPTYVTEFSLAEIVDQGQVILAGMQTGVQGEIQCKVLAALSTVK